MRDEERKPLNVAEKAIVLQMRRWPTLYRNAEAFLDKCVVGTSGDHQWKKGILVCGDNLQYVGKDKKGKPIYHPYPFRMSAETAQDLMNDNLSVFRSVNMPGSGPIDKLPDDLHKDWQEILNRKLYHDEKITPELYAVMVEAFCISYYGIRRNENANMQHYLDYWTEYWKRIPHYKARLEVIRKTQELGRVPPETFTGMDI